LILVQRQKKFKILDIWHFAVVIHAIFSPGIKPADINAVPESARMKAGIQVIK
jgi:hypothetical protein